MKFCILSLLLVAGCVYAAPVDQGGIQPGSCTDALAVAAANEALNKINLDRVTGYIFQLHRLSNVNFMTHEETGQVFYLTMEVLETVCHVLSKKPAADCMVRETSATPVYGQCRAIIYMNRPHRVVRLYKYDCAIRPVSSAKVAEICPDCPARMGLESIPMVEAAHEALKIFNTKQGMDKLFSLKNLTRASAQGGMAVFHNTEFVIEETVCDKTKDLDKDECPTMQCEFAHYGFCKASTHIAPDGAHAVTVDCEIYEPESAEREKQRHLLGGETDHSHSPRPLDRSLTHDHAHNHADRPSHTSNGSSDGNHHHSHDHSHGSAHRHAHDHSHDHSHDHDHVHAHHDKAHDHDADTPNKHHDYGHDASNNTHDHDHEHALDHEHNHAHLHIHEHHHHHHEHEHEDTHHDEPVGRVRMLPAVDEPMTLQAVPDILVPELAATLPVHPDPQIPGKTEPTILAFPSTKSAECPAPLAPDTLIEKLFAEDPQFTVSS